MPHPFLEHVQRNAVHGGVDPEAVTQAFRAAVRRIRYPGVDHDPLDDLPDPHAAKRPDRCIGLLARLLGLPDTMRGVECVQVVGRDRNAPIDGFRVARGIPALLQAAYGDRAAGQIDPGRGDFQKFGGPTAGIVQRLAEGAISRRLASGDGQKSRALFGVEIKPIPGGVGEAHFAHSQQSARKLLSSEAETGPLPCRVVGLAGGRLNSIDNSVNF